MSINANFPKQKVCLEEHFTKSLFPPSFHLQEVQPAATPHPFLIFSFIPTAAAPGCSPTPDFSHSWNPKSRRERQKKFFPQTGSFIPNLPALSQHLHCFWCPEREWKLLLWTGKSWVIKLPSRCLVLRTFRVTPRSQGADFFEHCILLQLAQLYQLSIELFHRSTSWLLCRPDRVQEEKSSHSSSDC